MFSGTLLILDNSVHKYCSFGDYIISEIISKNKNIFKKELEIIALININT